MNKITGLFLLFAFMTFSVSVKAQQPTKTEPMTTRESDFLQKAAGSAIFIYGASLNPCQPLPPEKTILPSGSGFVVGITKKTHSTPEAWNGWKFLITAKHVIANESQIIIRLNLAHELKFKCFPLTLQTSGQGQNVFRAPSGIDLVAISLPEISGADPTVLDASLLLDEAQMRQWNIGVGTQVFTVGYLLGYSGQTANFPVTKFGEVSVVTNEAWYYSPDSKLVEQGYVVQLPIAPGLSGGPVLTHGTEFDTNPFRFRQLPPFVVGVVKGFLLAPVNGYRISQGVAVIEPASNLKTLIRQIATMLKSAGADVDVN